MQKRNLQEDAKRFLREVSQEKCFWVNNGPILKNIQELSAEFKTMKEETFKHHVNSERNDFAKWIAEVVEDKKLAESLSKIRNKRVVIKKLDFRINKLRSALN